jgi:ComF family protein
MFNALLQRAAVSLPSQCAVCRLWQADVLCADCRARHPTPSSRCVTCARALSHVQTTGGVHCAEIALLQCGNCVVLAAQGKLALASCHAAVSYGFPWDGLVAEFKFRSHTAWAHHFAEYLLRQAQVRSALVKATWIIPLPLSDARLQGRGYNQAALLAKALAAGVSGCFAKLRQDMLLRVRETTPQPGLNRAARQANLNNAFAVDPLLVARLSGQTVALVDDVMTSGASLYAAAHTLRAAGAASVSAIVFARTEDDDFIVS